MLLVLRRRHRTDDDVADDTELVGLVDKGPAVGGVGQHREPALDGLIHGLAPERGLAEQQTALGEIDGHVERPHLGLGEHLGAFGPPTFEAGQHLVPGRLQPRAGDQDRRQRHSRAGLDRKLAEQIIVAQRVRADADVGRDLDHAVGGGDLTQKGGELAAVGVGAG